MIAMRTNRRSTRLLAMLAVAGVVTLSACAEQGGSGGSGGGEGLDPGASKEDYIAAFESVDPITIRTQSPAPKGSATGKNIEDYLASIEEWSDGKISFDIAYANAVADPAEIDDALNDGRLDLGQVLPIYEPSEYPATVALIETGFISHQSPVVGALQSNAWPNEVAFDTPEILQEWDDHGLVPLVPIYNSGSNGLFCSQERNSLSSISGQAIGSGGSAQSKQIESLGGSPASIAYTELYESLERGVVGCTVSSPTVAVLGGYLSEAPNVVIDDQAGFALAPGGMAFSKATWETLPLVAQQLFWDRLDVFIGGNISSKIWPNTVEAAATVTEAGGSFTTFDDEARAAMQEANEGLLDSVRQASALDDANAFVDGAQESADRWFEIVTDELGYTDEVGYEDFDTWYSEDAIDIDAFLQKLLDDTFAEHRPS
ncbi:C4-dicarboxylate ABC transporter substrate-binding protein [Aeromicrobium piscarium]|uniref:C4-dicarboxylate ABC transporter substrate-binding protein n=1 Tax=Aeromicrobium piscarium TaxID=2590901 RepID=A0A554SDD2_9ACTN|nr:C4-dicarboxylate ABC transporter substrate-binding protein [Aeromicrobium piscarium]TSD64336.1 C4-dicarboxylate ABC transporter substrate-binding protein [Aeromicrobium piscarium]